MKAHIATEPRTLLLWRFAADAPGAAALETLAAAYQLTLRRLTESDLNTAVGALCGLAGVTALPDGAPAPAALARPAMILSGLGQRQGELNAFLTALKDTGADIPLKAMMTATSKGWTLARLLGELSAEHEALNAPAPEVSES